MVKISALTEKDLEDTIKAGEIPEAIRKAADNVAVVLTQSWCPQWLFMRSFLSNLDKKGCSESASIFVAEYDKMKTYHDFRSFKESSFNNWEVPYVRYYREGQLIGESNFVSKDSFLGYFC